MQPLDPRNRARLGLSSRLLALTVLFVMVAQVLIYVPSIANFRRNWLHDRIAAAQIAAIVIEAAPDEQLPAELEQRLLDGVGAIAIAVRGGGARRLLASSSVPSEVSRTVDLRVSEFWPRVRSTFMTLIDPAELPIRVVDSGMGESNLVEIVMDERPLRQAMIDFSRDILLGSLLISAITAGLLYLALQLVIVRPVRRLTGAISSFAEAPEDASRVIAPSGRTDEIGVAERSLAGMETVLSDELRQKRHLAELGLAVSKINHELRNMLTTAQLLTDRLEKVSDPQVQRIAPRLVATLGRAIDFCQATLAYGRASERLPQRRRLALAPLVAEVAELAHLAPGAGIAFAIDVPDGLEIDADADQLSRILVNLTRNAVQALARAGTANGAPTVTIAAVRRDGAVTIRVADNGPGLPERARENLFEAFRGSSAAGGTGLGLPIAAELARAHGGTIVHEPSAIGTVFRVTIPDRR